MALDWSKEITFSGLRKSMPKRKDVYPSKTYMNLAIADRKPLDLRKVVPLAVLLLVVIVLLLKFGVFDQFAQVNAKRVELEKQEQTLSSLEEQLVGYDDLLREYQAYMPAQLAADEETVSALDALSLVNRKIEPMATIVSVSYADNELALNLANISLGTAGNLVSSLYEEPFVAHVEVSTAATGDTSDETSTVAMTISLDKAGDN